MYKAYAGIGSRSTPDNILRIMSQLASVLAKNHWTLRSGGAPGADQAFEEGHNGKKEIFLPWKEFEGNSSSLYGVSEIALWLAEKYHPAWHNLKRGGQLMMARNMQQVLGEDLLSPVQFVLCWTKNGMVDGGTGQAMRLAQDLCIPIFNLHTENELEKFKAWYRKNHEKG